LLMNPRDNVACERIINVPARGIGATTLGRLRAFAEDHRISLFEATRQVGRIDALGKSAAGKVALFAQLIDELAGLTAGAVRDLVETVIDRTGLETDLRSHGSEDGSELSNVEELVSSAADFDRDSDGGALADYLHRVALVSDIDRFEGATGAVTLMTLHAAKGLEFPVVIMVGCERGLLPFHRAFESDADEEEERRLCFVGMTRAKDHLLLTHAIYRGIRGSRQRQIPSNFLADLDGEHVTHLDLSTPMEQSNSHAGSEIPEPPDPWDLPEEAPDDFDDGFYDPDADAEGPATEATGLQAGTRVRHPSFGIGRVVKVRPGGPYTRVIVEFYQVGRKTLVLQFARLELIP